MRRKLVTLLLAPGLLAGCVGTISGFDGSSQFACKAPDGVTCSSLSGVYANAVANNLPGQRQAQGEKVTASSGAGRLVGRAPSAGDPIRSQPKVLRVWLAPWEDDDGDFHDQAYLYVVADPGRWVIEHQQKRIVDRYRPTFISPLQAGTNQKPAAPAPSSSVGSVVLPGNQAYGPGTPQPNAGGQP